MSIYVGKHYIMINFLDELSENEKMHYLYSLYSNIKNHYFYGKNTDSITEVFSEISIYPDIYSSKIEYYDEKGNNYVAFSRICKIQKQNYVYYVLFKCKYSDY